MVIKMFYVFIFLHAFFGGKKQVFFYKDRKELTVKFKIFKDTLQILLQTNYFHNSRDYLKLIILTIFS